MCPSLLFLFCRWDRFVVCHLPVSHWDVTNNHTQPKHGCTTTQADKNTTLDGREAELCAFFFFTFLLKQAPSSGFLATASPLTDFFFVEFLRAQLAVSAKRFWKKKCGIAWFLFFSSFLSTASSQVLATAFRNDWFHTRGRREKKSSRNPEFGLHA